MTDKKDFSTRKRSNNYQHQTYNNNNLYCKYGDNCVFGPDQCKFSHKYDKRRTDNSNYYNGHNNYSRYNNNYYSERHHKHTNSHYKSKSPKEKETERKIDRHENTNENTNKNEIENENENEEQQQQIDNLSIQNDELTALKSIFDEEIMKIDEEKRTGRFIINPNLPNKPYYVLFEKYNANDRKMDFDQMEIDYLTPIELYFELVPEYPTKTCPGFLISCKWLTLNELDLVCQKLEMIWADSKMEVLFSWHSFLHDQLLEFLNHSSNLIIPSFRPRFQYETKDSNFRPRLQYEPKDTGGNYEPKDTGGNYESKDTGAKCEPKDTGAKCKDYNNYKPTYRPRTKRDEKYETRTIYRPKTKRGSEKYDRRAIYTGPELKSTLELYNEYKRKEAFMKSWFVCNICLSEQQGVECARLGCSHRSCKKCVSEYFSTMISEGSVHSLTCPELDCDTAVSQSLVRELVSDRLYERYDELLLNSLIQTMSDIVYCPRPHCQTPVMADTHTSLACCPGCDLAFCKFCKFTFHGIDPCQLLRHPDKRRVIIDKYKLADQSDRAQLENIYGKQQLLTALEHTLSEEWIENNSKQCPKCRTYIEKIDGCNKIWCWKCNSNFCWLCLTPLSLVNPYEHFSDTNSKCFKLLFQGVVLDHDFDFDL